MEINPLKKSSIKKVPNAPGVYLFWNKEKNPLYIGKATSLKHRLASYFGLKLAPKTAQMVSEASFLSLIRTTSELEALLLEAKLVKHYLPKYNSQLKDDKHPLYIRISKEKYPRVLTARKLEATGNLAFFGPFPSSANVKNVLKMLRRIFPYAEHSLGKRACLYSQIGLCNPCPNEILNLKNKHLKARESRRYRKNINMIREVLSGRIKSVRLKLQREMQEYAAKEQFEEAKEVCGQIEKLNYITQPIMNPAYFLRNPNLVDDIRNEETKALRSLLAEYLKVPRKLSRIECYDVSHLAGTASAASMVTFIEGEPEKAFYRHFRIRQKKAGDDIASLKEVIRRRTNHLSDWGKPDLIIVDGGAAQTSVFLRELESQNIPVVGLAKRYETLVIPKRVGSSYYLKQYRLPDGLTLNFLQRIRNEAHRFARRYHHKLTRRRLLGGGTD